MLTCSGVVLYVLGACTKAPGERPARTADTAEEEVIPPPAGGDWSRAIHNTDLRIDVASRTGSASLSIDSSDSLGLSLDARGLDISSVRADGVELQHQLRDGVLEIGLPE